MKPILVALCLFALGLPLQADLYVAPGGDDTNLGTEAAPFATLERARQEVRTINSGMDADLVVQVAPGNYPVTTPLAFDASDSGMNGHKVIYRAIANPGSARILGGQLVTNWQPYQGQIVMADLGLPGFHTLYENGRRARKARYPNFVPDPALPLAQAAYLRATGANGSYTQLQYAAGSLNPGGWDLTDAQVYLWPGGKWAWFTDTVHISSINPGTRTITLAEDARYPVYKNSVGSRFFVQGVLDLLDEPGEFHYDSAVGRLYYWPMDGPAADQEIVVPQVKRILSLQGGSDTDRVHDLRFEGLGLEFTDFTDWYRHAHVSAGDSGDPNLYPQYDRQATLSQHREGAVFLENTESISFDSCVVRNTGYSGFGSFGANRNNTFQRLSVSHTGLHGFFFEGLYPGEGDLQTLNTVDNCLIHDVGELVGQAAGVQLTNVSHHEISYCAIYNSPRYAVALGAYVDIPLADIYVHDNSIHHLRIQHCCQDSGDTAPIYAWGLSDDPPYHVNSFAQLIIDDTYAHPSMIDYAPNGVFLDNDTFGQELSNIDVHNSQNAAYRVNSSSGMVLSNVNWQAGFDPSQMDYDSIGVRADHPFAVPPMRLVGHEDSAGVSLDWLTVANAGFYTVYTAPSASGPWVVSASGVTESAILLESEVLPGTMSWYCVTATGPLGDESIASSILPVFRPGGDSDRVYSFEDCLGGDLSGSSGLQGNDNWAQIGGTNTKWVVDGLTHGLPAGYTGNFTYGTTGSADSQYSRKNDTNFSYQLADTGTITFSFLVSGRNTGNQICALGGDANGDGLLSGGTEFGCSFGISAGNWHLREATFGTIYGVPHGLPASGNDTYEVRLLLDPSANSGDGAGWFAYRNITVGGLWTNVAGLQNIPMALSLMDPAVRQPSAWNGLYLRLGPDGCRIDNLVIDQFRVADGPHLAISSFDPGGSLIFSATNLDPLQSYLLKRGEDLVNFPDAIGAPLSGVGAGTVIDPVPPPMRAFYRLEK